MDVSRKDEKMIEIDVRRRGESRSSSCATLSHMDRRMEFYFHRANLNLSLIVHEVRRHVLYSTGSSSPAPQPSSHLSTTSTYARNFSPKRRRKKQKNFPTFGVDEATRDEEAENENFTSHDVNSFVSSSASSHMCLPISSSYTL